MEDYPRTTTEFEDRFASEEACRRYLYTLRWPNGFVCPQCGGTLCWEMRDGRYLCRHCRYQASLTAGTVFQDMRKPLRLWFQAIWYVTSQKNGVSALGLQRVLGLGSYHTAWTWLHKLRRAMVRPGRDRLGGTVEVDETFIGGKRQGLRGRSLEGKSLVLVAAEEVEPDVIGRIRLRRIDDGSAASLRPAVQECVEPGSEVRTDGWNGYAGLGGLGYRHTVRPGAAQPGETLLPLVSLVASLLKRWLLGTHQGAVRSTHLDYYLDEFTFRFNRRTSRSRGKLFYRMVEQAAAAAPAPAKTLRADRGRQTPDTRGCSG